MTTNFVGICIALFVPLSVLVWVFRGDGSRGCCITWHCSVQPRLLDWCSLMERVLSILIFESLLNVDTSGYLLLRKAAVVGMLGLSKKQQNKHTSITSTSEKTTEAYK